MSMLITRSFSFYTLIVLCALIVVGCVYYFSHPKVRDVKHVSVIQFIEFPSLAEARQGVKDGLEKEGFIVGKNLRWSYDNSTGQMGNLAQIAKKHVIDRPDVLVAITTPAAQVLKASGTDIPIVFVAVSDPVGAKLVKSLDHTGGNITGTIDFPPILENLNLIRQIMPAAKKIGIIMNPGEPNSVTIVNAIKQLAPTVGLTLDILPALKTSDVMPVARRLAMRTDALLIPLDNTVTAVAQAVAHEAKKYGIPVFALDTAIVKEGALAAIGFSEYDGGVLAGQMVSRILRGAKASQMPVTPPGKKNLHLSKTMAQALKITLPEKLLKAAAKVE